MPSAIDTTISGANANSYLTLAEAEAYFDDRLNISAWQDTDADNRTRALLHAAQRLERENWLGDRATTTQRLAWPRIGVAKVDATAGVYPWVGSGGYSYGISREEYESDEIPQQIKDAQCELALHFLANGAAPGAGNSRVKSFSADGLSVTREFATIVGSLPEEIAGLLAALTSGNKLARA